MRILMAGALVGVLLTGVARAETQSEMAYGLGQFAGAAAFCKISQAEITAVMGPLLVKNGIKADGPSPEMTQFQQGVTAGVQAMNAPDAAPCSAVKSKFNEAKASVVPGDDEDDDDDD